jgi:hypothetical protein
MKAKPNAAHRDIAEAVLALRDGEWHLTIESDGVIPMVKIEGSLILWHEGRRWIFSPERERDPLG